MKTAIIIKGNPIFIDGNSNAEMFYSELKFFLESLGYSVSFDPGLPHTKPVDADLWVSHSWGSSRLQFAPINTKTIALGTKGGINHLEDKALEPGQIPGKSHYILSEQMKNEIKKTLNMH
jgi:hypothetical protein